jgi:dephospho-CoA kinase
MSAPTKLIFFCGKMAAGKSTLARDLAQREQAVLLVQDDFLEALYPGEITDIPAFVTRYSRLKDALTPHVARSIDGDLGRARLRSEYEGPADLVS